MPFYDLSAHLIDIDRIDIDIIDIDIFDCYYLSNDEPILTIVF